MTDAHRRNTTFQISRLYIPKFAFEGSLFVQRNPIHQQLQSIAHQRPLREEEQQQLTQWSRKFRSTIQKLIGPYSRISLTKCPFQDHVCACLRS